MSFFELFGLAVILGCVGIHIIVSTHGGHNHGN